MNQQSKLRELFSKLEKDVPGPDVENWKRAAGRIDQVRSKRIARDISLVRSAYVDGIKQSREAAASQGDKGSVERYDAILNKLQPQ